MDSGSGIRNWNPKLESETETRTQPLFYVKQPLSPYGCINSSPSHLAPWCRRVPRTYALPQADVEPLEAAMQPHVALPLGRGASCAYLWTRWKGGVYICVYSVYGGCIWLPDAVNARTHPYVYECVYVYNGPPRRAVASFAASCHSIPSYIYRYIYMIL